MDQIRTNAWQYFDDVATHESSRDQGLDCKVVVLTPCIITGAYTSAFDRTSIKRSSLHSLSVVGSVHYMLWSNEGRCMCT